MKILYIAQNPNKSIFIIRFSYILLVTKYIYLFNCFLFTHIRKILQFHLLHKFSLIWNHSVDQSITQRDGKGRI